MSDTVSPTPSGLLSVLGLPFKALGRRIAAQREQLPHFAWMQLALTGLTLLLAKAQAVRFCFPFDTFSEQASAWVVGIAPDVLSVGVLAVLVWVVRNRTVTRSKLRWSIFLAIQVLCAGWIFLTLFNLEYFMHLGSPLKYQALQLVEGATGIFALNIIKDHAAEIISMILYILALICVSPLLMGLTQKLTTRSTLLASGYLALPFPVLLLGAGLSWHPATGFREQMLREMNVASLFIHSSEKVETGIAPPTPEETQTLLALCSDQNAAGVQALKNFPRRKYNVIVWVWESVGLRYLKSLHPLGNCSTPNLDKIMAAGSVSFSECRSECPFSSQSMWALMSGMTPPARPVWFSVESELPPHAALLAPQFKDGGYTTAYFNASNMKVGWMDRILKASGFEVAEDSTNLKGREKYRSDEWGLEDAAPLERCLDWLDHERSKEKPFFCMLWNKETHFPYTWKGMPEALKKENEATRYKASVEQSDQNLGKLYTALTERGLDRDTLLVILGDHGEATGRPPYTFHIGHAFHPDEDVVHVPFILANPALKGLTDKPVPTRCSIRDVYPTLFDLNGLPIPAGINGHSLAQPFEVRPLFIHGIGWWPISALAGKYKLTLYHPSQLPQLFNLELDPTEKENLAHREMDLTRTLLNCILRETERSVKEDPTFSWGWGTNKKPVAPPTVKDLMKEIQNEPKK